MTKEQFKQEYERLCAMEAVPYDQIEKTEAPRKIVEVVGAITDSGSMVVLRSCMPEGVGIEMLRPLPDGRCSRLSFGLSADGANRLLDVLSSVL